MGACKELRQEVASIQKSQDSTTLPKCPGHLSWISYTIHINPSLHAYSPANMKRHGQSKQSRSKMALDSELRGFGRWRSEGNKDSWVCKAVHPGVDFQWVNWLPVADSNSVGSCQNQCLFSLLREMFLVGRLSREATVTNDWAALRAGTLASGSWGSDSYFCHGSLCHLRHAT